MPAPGRLVSTGQFPGQAGQLAVQLRQFGLGWRIGLQQRGLAGQSGLVQPLAICRQKPGLIQRGLRADQAVRVFQQRIERIEAGFAALAAGFGVGKGLFAGHQRGGQAGKGVGGQAGNAETLAHAAVYALHQGLLRIPVRQRGQALAPHRPGLGCRWQGEDAPQQGAQAVACQRVGLCHGGFEAVDARLMLADLGAQGIAACQQGALGMLLRDPFLIAAAQIGDEGFLVALRIVDQAAQRRQPALLEAVEHYIQRGAFFADEQHPLPAPGIVGDQVGDGLGFAGARRALDDEAAPVAGKAHGGILGSVRGHHIPLRGDRQRRRGGGLQFARLNRENAVQRRVGVRLGEQLRVIAHQRHLAVIEIGQGDLSEVQIPGVAMAFAFLQHIAGALARRFRHLAHVRLAGRRGGTRLEALGQGAGRYPVFVERAAQRAIVFT